MKNCKITVSVQWSNDMESAPKDGTPLWLFNEDWIDEDFNPQGICYGSYCDGLDCWVVAYWDSVNDEYSKENKDPSHWARMVNPLRPWMTANERKRK